MLAPRTAGRYRLDALIAHHGADAGVRVIVPGFRQRARQRLKRDGVQALRV